MARTKSRYAPDKEIERAFRLAKQAGFVPSVFRLGADGSVTLLAFTGATAMSDSQEDFAETALAQWEGDRAARRS